MIAARSEKGFALFVVAALFMAFALLAGAMIDRTNATQQVDMQMKTRDQMARIYYALIQYSLDNSNRYPCPADPAIAYTNANFGISITDCHSGLSGLVTQLTPPAGSVAIRGMVPVRALIQYGIQPSDAFDMWNNRIMYVVDREMTPEGSGTAGAVGNRPVVNEDYLTLVFKSPDFLLLSYGKDGLGAIPRPQTTVATACGAAGDPRKINCDNNRTFSIRPHYTGPSAVAGDYFDDIILLFSRGAGQ